MADSITIQAGNQVKLLFCFLVGGQYVNMGAGLAMEFSSVRRVWDNAAAISLDPEHALQQVVFPIPVFSDAERKQQTDLLTRTGWAQPAIGAASTSLS